VVVIAFQNFEGQSAVEGGAGDFDGDSSSEEALSRIPAALSKRSPTSPDQSVKTFGGSTSIVDPSDSTEIIGGGRTSSLGAIGRR